EPVAELEALRPLAVGGAEVADESGDDAVDPRKRGEERARVALAEERAGVRDPEALAAAVLEAGEVVEVRAVRDVHDGPARRALAHLVGDRLRHGDDRFGLTRDEQRDEMLA